MRSSIGGCGCLPVGGGTCPFVKVLASSLRDPRLGRAIQEEIRTGPSGFDEGHASLFLFAQCTDEAMDGRHKIKWLCDFTFKTKMKDLIEAALARRLRSSAVLK